MNSQGLTTNIDDIRHVVFKLNPSVVCVTETHVTTDVYRHEIEIKGYTLEVCESQSRHTGGVVIYVKDGLKYQVNIKSIIECNMWLIGIRINTTNFKHIQLCALYHSPNSSHKIMLDYLEDWLERFVTGENVVIVGDFNINVEQLSTYSNRLNDLIRFAGMNQVVRESTRVTENSRTTIDLVITNIVGVNVKVMHTPKVTDHALLSISLKKILNVPPSQVVKHSCVLKRPNMGEEDFDAFNHIMIEQDWCYDKTDVNEVANKFVSNMIKGLDDIAPVRAIKIKVGSKYCPWFTDDISKCRMLRDRCYNKAQLSNDREDWSEYKKSRNLLVNKLRIEKSRWFERQVDEYKYSPDKLWKTLKGVIGKNQGQRSTQEITFPQNDNEASVAENFNNFFITSIKGIIEDIEELHDDEGGVVNCNSNVSIEDFKELSLKELKVIVMGLKNKSGTDEGISTKLLKKSFRVCGYPLLNLVNLSLRTGEFPSKWKTSTVIPIMKSANAEHANEFRPINMLPIYEKIMELAVHAQVSKYLNENNLLYANQSGFRVGHSCESSIQLLMSKWKRDLDDDKCIVAVFLDLKRAFETVDRGILLNKLEGFGIKGRVHSWFRSYLADRKQFTKYSNEISDECVNDYGVPQGSVLGPLLFLLYINDIHTSVEMREVFLNLFADDTMLSCSGYNIDELCDKVNKVLQLVERWLLKNKLKLNVTKTKCMIITSSPAMKEKHLSRSVNPFFISIGVETVEIVKEFKYLGILITEHLNFTNHVRYIANKLRKKIGLLFRVGKFLSPWAREIIYKAIIAPHFEYCSTILWDIDKKDMELLQRMQNRGMRAILRCHGRTHIATMLDILNFLSVKQRIALNVLKFVDNLSNGRMPIYFKDEVTFLRNVHNYSTRSANQIVIKRVGKSATQRSVFYSGFQLYNNLIETFKCGDEKKIKKVQMVTFVKTMFGNK